MNTNEEQACGACGEPASAHPAETSFGTCRVYSPPTEGLKRLRLAVKAAPKRPDPTPEQERALGRREAFAERIQENLAERKALFAAAAEADAECAEHERIAPNALVDIEAITYGLGTCEAFLPRELSDDRKRRWHLILDPIEDPRAHGFMLLREPADPSQAPSEELLSLLRGEPEEARQHVVTRKIENLTEEKRRLAAAFFEVARALLPDATSELEAVPIQDAVISMLGRIDGLRGAAKEAERAAQRTAKANEEAAIEIRDRSLHLAAALCVASSTPWRELVAIAAASIVKRDQVIAQLEARPFDSDQIIRLAYLLGCERVPIPAVGAKAIEVIEAALEGLGAKTGDNLLHAVAAHRTRIEVKPKEDPYPALCPALHPGATHIRCSLLRGHEGAEHVNLAHDLVWRDEKAPRFATPSHVLLEARLADVEARIGQPGPLDALEQRIEKLERSDAEWEPMLDRRDQVIDKRLTELEKVSHALETAGTEILSSKHQLGQEFTKALEGLSQTDKDIVKTVQRAFDRLGELEQSIRNASAAWAGNAARVERLEGWRKRVSKQFGPEAEGGPMNGAMLADNARLEAERDAALDELKQRPNVDQGKFTHLADLKRGDWVVFDGAPREVVGLSPAEVVLDVNNAPVRIDRTGGALRLVWRPGPRE